MKTILNVIDTTGPGGAETIFIQLAKEIANRGNRSIALIRGSGWVEQQLKENNIPVHIIDCKGSFNIKYLFAMVKLIRSENVDVIQSHLLGSNVYSSIAGMLTRTRVISTFHGLVDISPSERFRTIKLLALRFGSYKIVTVTDKLKNLVTKLPVINKNQVATIYNGIDTDAFKKIDTTSLRTKLGITSNDILIGSLGNIRKPKDYPLAIKTIKALHDQGRKVHYAIAGQGSDKQQYPLIELIKKYNLNKYIHILGFTKDTQAFLSSLDVFLMTSSSEGHPLALTQAMVSEAPIVSTKSGVEEIVENGKEALVTDSNTDKELAQKIIELLKDNSLGKLIAKNSLRKSTTQFSLKSMFNAYFELY